MTLAIIIFLGHVEVVRLDMAIKQMYNIEELFQFNGFTKSTYLDGEGRKFEPVSCLHRVNGPLWLNSHRACRLLTRTVGMYEVVHVCIAVTIFTAKSKGVACDYLASSI